MKSRSLRAPRVQHTSVLKSGLASRWSTAVSFELRVGHRPQNLPPRCSQARSTITRYSSPSTLWNRTPLQCFTISRKTIGWSAHDHPFLAIYRTRCALLKARPRCCTRAGTEEGAVVRRSREMLEKRFEGINLHRNTNGREWREGKGKSMFINRRVYERLLRVIAPNWLIWLSNAAHASRRVWFIVRKRNSSFIGYK